MSQVLQICWPFDAGRRVRRREQVCDCLLQVRLRVLAIKNGAGITGDRMEHLQLAWNLMDHSTVATHEFAVDLAGNVQHAASRGERLHH
ncbi:hypothetical protein D3C73_1072990 [compost metagenome]